MNYMTIYKLPKEKRATWSVFLLHLLFIKNCYCSSQASFSVPTIEKTMNDRSTDRLSPGGWGVQNASQLTLSQELSSSMLMTRKCNKISVDVLLAVSTGAIASIFCVYLLTVEVLDIVKVKERLNTWAKKRPQEGGALFSFCLQLETSNNSSNTKSFLLHVLHAKNEIDWKLRNIFWNFFKWSRKKSCQVYRSYFESKWVFPSRFLVLTVVLTLRLLLPLLLIIGSGGGGLSSSKQMAFSSVFELGVVRDGVATNAVEPARNFFTTTSLNRAYHFYQKNAAEEKNVAESCNNCWSLVGNASATLVARMSEGMLVLCFVAVATVLYSSVLESFMRLTVDVFLEALTTSRTQNCASICNNKSNCPSDEKDFGERRFSGIRLFDVSPTENSENESFSKRSKVDFLQKLAIWSGATDDGFFPSTTPFICSPYHLEDTLRCDDGRSRTEGSFSAFSEPSLVVPFADHADEQSAVDGNHSPPYLVERSDETEDGRTLQLDSASEREASEEIEQAATEQIYFVQTVKLPWNNQSSDMLVNTDFPAVVTVDADRSRVPTTLLVPILSQLEKRRSAGKHVHLLVLAVHSKGKHPSVEQLEEWLELESKLGRNEYAVVAVEDGNLIEKIIKKSVKSVPEKLFRSLTEIRKKLGKLKMSKSIATLAEIELSDLATQASMTVKEMLTYLRNFGLIWYEGLADTATSDCRILIDLSSPEQNLRQLLGNSVVAKHILNEGYVRKSVLSRQMSEDDRLLVSFLEHTGYILSHRDYFVIPRELRVSSPVTQKLNCVRLEPLIFQLENVARLPRFVFYNVVLRTLEEYPHAAHFYANEVLLRVEADHELMIAYGVSHLEAVMITRTDDRTLKTTETGRVCLEVKRRLLESLRTVCREAFGDEMCDVRLGIDAFARHDARDLLHFIDLTDVNSVSESEALKFAYKESPPKFLYAWFNETEPASVVQRKFHYYSERLNLTSNFDRVMDGLVAKGYASDKAISRIYAPSDLKARVNVLLNYFVRRGKTGDAILRELLPDEEDHGRATPASAETSAQTPLLEAMQLWADLSRQLRIALPSTARAFPSAERGRGIIYRGLAELITSEIDRQLLSAQPRYNQDDDPVSVSAPSSSRADNVTRLPQLLREQFGESRRTSTSSCTEMQASFSALPTMLTGEGDNNWRGSYLSQY